MIIPIFYFWKLILILFLTFTAPEHPNIQIRLSKLKWRDVIVMSLASSPMRPWPYKKKKKIEIK